ncbi:hypothetical protein DYST_03728 [Dyella terrae]|nr:hypothetical protein DYST_03728 [Dyella terrae]
MASVRIFVLRSHGERSKSSNVTIGYTFSHGLGRKQTFLPLTDAARMVRRPVPHSQPVAASYLS